MPRLIHSSVPARFVPASVLPAQRRCFHERFCWFLIGQQGFHFPPQSLIPAAGLLEELRPPALLMLQRQVIHAVNFLPALTSHYVCLVEVTQNQGLRQLPVPQTPRFSPCQ